MYDYIEIKGAREHNLKNVSINIPKNKLVTITGPSGSGKSTFAMDILQRECQRQYMESMGLVTDGMNKPKVDSIVGLSPSISISQNRNSKNPRSTVGTLTEALTYLRVLYAKLGERDCPNCHMRVTPDFSRMDINDGLDNEEKKVQCNNCGHELSHLKMAHFSFNKAEGFCETCSGLGIVNDLDLSVLVDDKLSLGEGAVKLWQGVFATHYKNVMINASKHYGFDFDPDKAIQDYNEIEKLVFYHGVENERFKSLFPDIPTPKKVHEGKVEGIYTYMQKKSAENIRKGTNNQKIAACFTKKICNDCGGSRLKKSSREVFIQEKSIVEVSKITIKELHSWLLSLEDTIDHSARELLGILTNDMFKRINGVINIGLSYLSLDRTLNTLSGGEAQRLRMARLLESGLTGVLYVLDEPTTGLHPRDTEKILESLKKIRDMGNTVLVIEHDMDFVKESDYVIDFGPGSGSQGGRIIASGTPSEVMENKDSLTGFYMNVGNFETTKSNARTGKYITIEKAYEHNLKNIDVMIPLNHLVVVTGVSGSGKSSLILGILARYKSSMIAADKISGMEHIDRVITVDQKGIGRSSRSNVATYTDTFSFIRSFFADLDGSKKKKLKSGDFSFNVKGGRCEKCQGLGSLPLDMHFLDDIEIVCPVCKGKRFHADTLTVEYHGNNISEILDKTVKENLEIFKDHNEISRRLKVLEEVGLDYLTLGQSTSTLSGGECQRIKLSKELGKAEGGHFLYLLDEPTMGLHPGDVEKLINLLKKMVNRGHSVVVIEHSLEVIRSSDWIIDMGPEGGTEGGYLIAEGPSACIKDCTESYTGKYI